MKNSSAIDCLLLSLMHTHTHTPLPQLAAPLRFVLQLPQFAARQREDTLSAAERHAGRAGHTTAGHGPACRGGGGNEALHMMCICGPKARSMPPIFIGACRPCMIREHSSAAVARGNARAGPARKLLAACCRAERSAPLIQQPAACCLRPGWMDGMSWVGTVRPALHACGHAERERAARAAAHGNMPLRAWSSCGERTTLHAAQLHAPQPANGHATPFRQQRVLWAPFGLCCDVMCDYMAGGMLRAWPPPMHACMHAHQWHRHCCPARGA